ncbi:MAG: hypothetical protein HYX84_05335 [Chloroflexi bacterium]|nr:hypothetical protein [Chloroflexota bacterium]
MVKKPVGLTLAVLLIVGITAGVWAYFSDTETSMSNSLTFGTLDLKINGGDAAVTTLTVSNAAPGESGSASSTITNIGTLSSELDITFSAITNTGGVIGEFGDGVGNLGAVTEMTVFIDADQDGTWSSGDKGLKSDGTTYPKNPSYPQLLYATMNSYSGRRWDSVKTMNGNDPDNFTIIWRIPSNTGNTIQGDSVSFNITFTLEQSNAD